jgi:hypothetical protein
VSRLKTIWDALLADLQVLEVFDSALPGIFCWNKETGYDLIPDSKNNRIDTKTTKPNLYYMMCLEIMGKSP